jgi:hypothetical protein
LNMQKTTKEDHYCARNCNLRHSKLLFAEI